MTKTKQECDELLKRLKKGEKMSELAEKHSIGPEAENGGEVGWVAKGILEETMDNVLFTLPQGEVSPVIETPYGYHIFEVISYRPAGIKHLPEVISEIEATLLIKKRELFMKKWLQGLRDRFPIDINQELLSTLELS